MQLTERETLLHHELQMQNLRLHPDTLAKNIIGYKEFRPILTLRFPNRVFLTTRGLEKLGELSRLSISKKRILGLSGVSAAGKDSVRKTMEISAPGLSSQLTTATTRPMRTGEIDGQTYYFYSSVEQFLEEVKAGLFIEYAPVHPGVYYGLPKYSLAKALQKSEQILTTHTEISGWEKLGLTTQELNIPFLKVFLLPNIPFNSYIEWLKLQRPKDFQTRAKRAVWELTHAPEFADVIMLNTIDPMIAGSESNANAQALIHLLTNANINELM